jgi:hypothetical protein
MKINDSVGNRSMTQVDPSFERKTVSTKAGHSTQFSHASFAAVCTSFSLNVHVIKMLQTNFPCLNTTYSDGTV